MIKQGEKLIYIGTLLRRVGEVEEIVTDLRGIDFYLSFQKPNMGEKLKELATIHDGFFSFTIEDTTIMQGRYSVEVGMLVEGQPIIAQREPLLEVKKSILGVSLATEENVTNTIVTEPFKNPIFDEIAEYRIELSQTGNIVEVGEWRGDREVLNAYFGYIMKGDAFTYEDFTPEQLEGLKPKKGVDYWTSEDKDEIVNDVIHEVEGTIEDFHREFERLEEAVNEAIEQVETLTNDVGDLGEALTDLNNKKLDKSEQKTKLSQLENDTKFISKSVSDLTNYYLKTETFTQQEVRDLVATISTMTIQIVNVLPTEDISTNTIYFVPKAEQEGNDYYNEYVYINDRWEFIGSTKVDLEGYATESWVTIQIRDFITSDDANSLVEQSLELHNKDADAHNDKFAKYVLKDGAKVLSDENFTSPMKDKLLATAVGLTEDWKQGVEDNDYALAQSILLKQNKLTAGHNIEILPFSEGGKDGTLISSLGRSAKTLLFEQGNGFDASLGLPNEQGWTEEKTGEAIITNVMVSNLMMTELTDSTNGGKADVIKPFTNEEFIKLLANGGRFYGISKLDQLHGNEGFWAGMQYSQSYRFGVHFRNEGGYLQVRGVNGEQVVHPITTFDGTDGKQRIWFTDLFYWEVVIPKNDNPLADYRQINSGELFINRQPTGILVDYVAGGGIGDTGCYLSSMSTGGDEHISYHSIFGYAINITEVVVTEEVIKEIDDLTIITPSGNLDLIITFDAGIKGRHAGDTFNIVANNIGGNIAINGNEVFLINGGQDLEIEIKEVGNFVATNGVNGGNEYSMTILTDLATKAYVDSLVGGVNSILDNINGEVI